MFARLELSASRHTQIDTRDHDSDNFYWDQAPLDLETLTIDDYGNGNSDFEYAWSEMLKIMVPIAILRMVPRTSDRGTQERKMEGKRILQMLQDWEDGLPSSFAPIRPPELIVIMEDPISQYLQPIHFGSLNVAVAMGTYLW